MPKGKIKLPPSPESDLVHYPQAPKGKNPIRPQSPASTSSMEAARLWDAAYNQLKKEHPKMMRWYEAILEILSTGIRGRDFHSTLLSPIFPMPAEIMINQADTLARRLQMQQLIDTWFNKIDEESSDKVDSSEFDHPTPSLKTGLQKTPSLETGFQKIAQSMPHAALAWAGACYSLMVLLITQRLVTEAKSDYLDFINLISKLEWFCNLHRVLTPPASDNEENIDEIHDEPSKKLVDLYRAILLYEIRIVCFHFGHLYFDFVGVAHEIEQVPLDRSEAKRQVDEAEKAFSLLNCSQVKVQLEKLLEETSVHDKEQSQPDKESQLMRDLHIALGKWTRRLEPEGSYSLPDLYQWILSTQEYKEFLDWDKADPKLLWVSGGPGRGKTLLFAAIASQLSARGKEEPVTAKLAFFFCGSSTFGSDNVAAVLKGLIWCLLEQQPLLDRHSDETRTSTRGKYFDDQSDFLALSEAFYSMIQDPNFEKTYFLVDAIDQCSADDGPGLDDFLHLISVSRSLSSKVRWLVSSSYTDTAEMALEEGGGCCHLSLDASPSPRALIEAVDRHITHKVSELAQEKSYGEALENEIVRKIRQRPQRNFLWVNIVCTALREEEKWYAVEVLQEMPDDLQKLYDKIGSRIQRLPREEPSFCREVLSTMAAAYQPLHISELSALAELREGVDVLTIVKKCSPFLEVRDNFVCFQHPSTKDYARQHILLPSATSQAHLRISERAINSLSTFLDEEILAGSAVATKQVDLEARLAPVRYTSIYWMRHICEITNIDKHPEVTEAVTLFLENYFVHWLKILGSMGRLSTSATMLLRLEAFLAKLSSTNKLLPVVRDAHRLLRFHRSVNRPDASLVQDTRLFWPSSNVVKQRSMPQWVVTRPLMENHPSHEFQSLRGHGDCVRCIAFSADGTQLASGSDDMTVRIWDVQAGTAQHTLRGHTDWIFCLDFSRTGLVASGAADSTVRLWNAKTGRPAGTLSGHWVWVQAVSFAPNGKKLVAASGQNLYVWDLSVDNKPELWKRFEAHGGSVSSVVLSPDGRFLVSGGEDNKVNIWDGQTYALLRTLNGHEEVINCVAFSPIGHHIASGSDDATIRVWDALTGNEIQKLSRSSDHVSSLAFSRDGSQLAVASRNCVIDVWNYKMEQLTQVLRGHTDFVTSVAFSPQGPYLASCSQDFTTRLWYDEPEEQTNVHEVEKEADSFLSYAHRIRALTVSLDGRCVASAMTDGTIHLWDGETGKRLRNAERMGHDDQVNSIAFSHDGQSLASASNDRTVRVYHVPSGKLRRSFSGHEAPVRRAVFGPDGQFIASASDDSTVRVWDLESRNGDLPQILRQPKGYAPAVAFSPDGQYLASGGVTVQVWERESGSSTWREKIIMDSNPHYFPGSYHLVLFYPDSRRILLSDGLELRTYDVQTEQFEGPLIKIARWFSRTLWFDGISTDYVMTACGAVPLICPGSSPVEPETQQPQPLPPGRHPYGISYSGEDKNWYITWKNEKVIFIPAKYRPVYSHVDGHKVVLGCASGDVLLFRFSTEMTPHGAGLDVELKCNVKFGPGQGRGGGLAESRYLGSAEILQSLNSLMGSSRFNTSA
ncbi:Heterokaryon incompatibility protein R, partial [Metarhizium hybridum]